MGRGALMPVGLRSKGDCGEDALMGSGVPVMQGTKSKTWVVHFRRVQA